MARGWESKSVESQIDSVRENQPAAPRALTEEQKRIQREREGLILARTNIQRQIKTANRADYRQSLEQALGELDAKIKALDSSS